MIIDRQREAMRIQNQIGRTARASGLLTLDEWIATIHQFDGLCAYCQEKPFEVLDHLVPVASNGVLSDGNCVPACRACNLCKSDRILCDVSSATSFSKKIEQVRDALRNHVHISNQNTPRVPASSRNPLQRGMISFTAPQLEWLETEAKRLGISVPELVRRLIDQARGEKK